MNVFDQYPKIIRFGDRSFCKYGDSYQMLIRVKAPRGWSRKMLAEWAHDQWATRCYHAYDCCGHWYTSVYTKGMIRHKGREWLIPVSGQQNV